MEQHSNMANPISKCHDGWVSSKYMFNSNHWDITPGPHGLKAHCLKTSLSLEDWKIWDSNQNRFIKYFQMNSKNKVEDKEAELQEGIEQFIHNLMKRIDISQHK